MAKDFNHIKEWLLPQLDTLGLSIENFARKCSLSRASVYFYMEDTYRPSAGIMAKMCAVLGRPLEEGLRQYTPRKVGRPAALTPLQTFKRNRRFSV